MIIVLNLIRLKKKKKRFQSHFSEPSTRTLLFNLVWSKLPKHYKVAKDYSNLNPMAFIKKKHFVLLRKQLGFFFFYLEPESEMSVCIFHCNIISIQKGTTEHKKLTIDPMRFVCLKWHTQHLKKC